jgi:hypothetical protein
METLENFSEKKNIFQDSSFSRFSASKTLFQHDGSLRISTAPSWCPALQRVPFVLGKRRQSRVTLPRRAIVRECGQDGLERAFHL